MTDTDDEQRTATALPPAPSLDPTDLDLRLVDDDDGYDGGMATEEAYAFLSQPIPPIET